MASLDKKIEAYMERSVDFLKEVTLQDDGKGAYIAEWNIKDKAKPTDDQLKAVESDADKLEKNATVIDNRKAEYGTVEQQLEYITENGLTKWQENVTAIKKKNNRELEKNKKKFKSVISKIRNKSKKLLDTKDNELHSLLF